MFRKLIVMCALIGAASVVGNALVAARVARCGAEDLRVGMGRSEVEAVLGGSDDPDHFLLAVVRALDPGETRRIWDLHDGSVVDVIFDKADRVRELQVWSLSEPWMARFRRWLHVW